MLLILKTLINITIGSEDKKMSKDKHVTLYKYMPLKHAVDSIKNKRLYLSDGKNFNDPFEITVINNKRKLHILCLTSSFRQMLMWSNYADSHKGICLTVEVPMNLVYNVCYTNERPSENSDLDEIINKSILAMKNAKEPSKILTEDYSSLSNYKKIAYIKGKEWSSEKEYRVVLDDNEIKKLEECLDTKGNNLYMHVKIKNVYLGVNFENNNSKIKKKIIKACQSNGIQTTQMELSKTDYSLKVGKKTNYPKTQKKSKKGA